MARKNAVAEIDPDEFAELEEENRLLTSRLDQITGAVKAAPEGASEEELSEVLDLVYDLAAPDDDFESGDPDDNQDETFEDED
jgi:hypothetical protein